MTPSDRAAEIARVAAAQAEALRPDLIAREFIVSVLLPRVAEPAR